jgi:membrane associated rhomboid family serine protease
MRSKTFERDTWSALLLTPLWRLIPVAVLLALMWLATAVNLLVLHGAWLAYGIRAHDPSGLWPNLLVAPLLHAGLAHLVANTVPFAVLGGLIALQAPWRFVLVSLAGAIIGAAVVWILGTPGSVHIGASGLVFTYFGWLIVRAIRERSILAIVLALVTLGLYGGVLWGLSPFQIGISWQGHLGGLLGGVGAASAWPARQPRARVRARPTDAAAIVR